MFDQLGGSVEAIAIGGSYLSLIPIRHGSSGNGGVARVQVGGRCAYVAESVATLLVGVSESVRIDLESQLAPGGPLDVMSSALQADATDAPPTAGRTRAKLSH